MSHWTSVTEVTEVPLSSSAWRDPAVTKHSTISECIFFPCVFTLEIPLFLRTNKFFLIAIIMIIKKLEIMIIPKWNRNYPMTYWRIRYCCDCFKNIFLWKQAGLSRLNIIAIYENFNFNMRESICGFILGGLVVLTFNVRELSYKMSEIWERSFRIYQVFMKKVQIKLTCSRTTCSVSNPSCS